MDDDDGTLAARRRDAGSDLAFVGADDARTSLMPARRSNAARPNWSSWCARRFLPRWVTQEVHPSPSLLRRVADKTPMLDTQNGTTKFKTTRAGIGSFSPML